MEYEAFLGNIDQDLVLEFFSRFSVFERDLKRRGFLRTGSNDAAAPDWTRFGESIRGLFSKEPIAGISAAAETLTRAAPRRQIVRDGRLGWKHVKKRDEESDEEFVLRLTRTVRNNLFHGGKYPDGPVEDVERDQELLRAAIVMLRACSHVIGETPFDETITCSDPGGSRPLSHR